MRTPLAYSTSPEQYNLGRVLPRAPRLTENATCPRGLARLARELVLSTDGRGVIMLAFTHRALMRAHDPVLSLLLDVLITDLFTSSARAS